MLVLPCDGSFVPAWVAQRLRAASAGKDDVIVAAHDGGCRCLTFALLPASVRDDLDAYLAAGGHKIDIVDNPHGGAGRAGFIDTPSDMCTKTAIRPLSG
ncbi:MAG TPA: hypothetical protein VLZ55_02850 [Rhodanobacter sp.]|nr:hypothetical protein [Rhodanobacter sp.]